MCLHVQIAQKAAETWGVDLDRVALAKVREWLPEDQAGRIRYFHGNVEDLAALDIRRCFEIVFAGSIIEHLSNVGRMLEGARDLIGNDGELIIVTPHAFGLLQELRVALWHAESINPEHTCWFSVGTLKQLCARHGLRPVEWFTGYGYRKPSLQVSVARAVGVPFFRFLPHLGGSLIGVFKKD